MANATQQALDSLKNIQGRVEAAEKKTGELDDIVKGLLKAVEKPASRAGLTPQEFLAKTTQGGQTAGSFDSERGHFTTVSGRRKQLGRGFNEVLTAIYNVRKDGDAQAPGAVKVLNQYGVSKAALAENSGTTGGYTVPPVFSNELMTLAIEESIVRPRATIKPMTSMTLQVPSLDITTNYGAGESPFLGGVVATWTSEGATRTESEPQFRQTELKAWELSFYTVASNNILADNAVGLDSLLTQLFTSAIAWYTDYAYIQGNGVGKPVGIQNAAATIQVNRSGGGNTIVYTDLASMWASLYFGLTNSASLAWVCHQSCLAQVLKLSDQSGGTGSATNSGRFAFVSIDEGAQKEIPRSAGQFSFGTIFGQPLLVSEKLPALGTTGDLMLCDFSKYLIGDRLDLQIDVSPHVKFLNNQMVWRIVFRGDGQPWLNNPITLADGTKTVSPFVLLN